MKLKNQKFLVIMQLEPQVLIPVEALVAPDSHLPAA
jgi:hypothetical protein